MANKIRADLQALRGVAIAAVLLFHFFPQEFPNGYVGVDQFFVLSGYLIAMVLYSKYLNRGAIIDFYHRRVKRIVPLYISAILLNLIAIHTVFPQSNVEQNVESAICAMTFTTNIANISPDKAYAIMLKMAVDITHTWSLAVEMQFYLMVPLIFYLTRMCGYYALIAIGTCSFVYSVNVGGEIAFNSVFARLWQFCVGIGALVIVRAVEKHTNVEKKPLLGCGFGNEMSRRVAVVSYLTLGIMVVQMFMPAAIPDDMLRCTMTFLTGLLIVLGHDAPIWPMTLGCLTYLGNISYALYLIHWPIYAYTKTIYQDDAYVLCFALSISIMLAIVITETYEKWYLRLDSSSIYRMVALLYGACLLFLIPQMINAINYETSTILLDFRNLTKGQIMALNRRWSAEDYQLKRNLSCQYRDEICEYKPNNLGAAGPSILTIGNSYAANGAELVFDNCRNVTSRISLYWITGCEPLIAERPPFVHKTRCSPDVIDKFLPIVQRVNPDILFIHVRHYQLTRLQTNNGSILEDTFYMEARRRLISYEPFVSKRIYIIGVLPTPVNGITTIINDAIKAGKDLKMADLINFDMHTDVAKLRIDALIKDCEMCDLVDWAPDLTVEGEFQLFDKRQGLAYFTNTMHPTPLALKKMKKTLSRVCYARDMPPDDLQWLVRLLLILIGYGTVAAPVALLVHYVRRRHHASSYGYEPRTWFCKFMKLFAVGNGSEGYEMMEPPTNRSTEEKESVGISRFKKDCYLISYYFFGIQVTFLAMGFLQEKIMTQGYERVDDANIAELYSDPQFLILCNRIACLVVCGLTLARDWAKQPPHVPPLYVHSYTSVSNTLSSWCQYEALKFVSFPTQTICKASKVVSTMLMGRILRGQRYSWTEYGTGAAIATGASLFLLGNSGIGLGGPSTSLSGIILMAGFLAFDSFTLNWQKSLLDAKPKMSKYQMMMGVNAFSVVFCLVSLVEQGTLSASMRFGLEHNQFARDVVLLSLTGAIGQLFIYGCIEKYGPIAFSVIMTIRQMLSIVLSSIYYSHPMSWWAVIGCSVVFAAIFFDIQRRYFKQMRQPQPHKEKVTI